MRKFYLLFVGLFIGLSSVTYGQEILPYTKADDTDWSEVQIDVEKTSWNLTGSGLYISAQGGGGGGKSGNLNAQNWAISPAIQLKDVSNFLEYSDIRSGSNGSSFAVKIAQDDAGSVPPASSFVTVIQWTTLQTNETSQRLDLSSWSGQIVRLAFVRTNEVAGSWDVNNIEVVGSDLPEVVNFKVSEITNSSISLIWTEPESGLEYLLVGADGEIDFIPSNGTSYTAGDPAGSNNGEVLMSSTSVTHTESGLGEFDTRFYKVWSYDPATHEYSLAGSTANATTIGNSTVFYEDFEGTNSLGSIDTGTDPDHRDWVSDNGYTWTIESSNFWYGDEWLINGSGTSFRGAQSAHIVQHGATAPTYFGNTGSTFEESILVDISSAVLDASSYKSAELSFFWKAGGKAGYDYGDVYINGTKMTSSGLTGQASWKEEVIDVTNYLGQDITLKFYWHNGPGYIGVHEPSFCLDEVMITGKSVERPQSFSATAVNTSQIDLSWQKNSEDQDVIVAYSSSGTLGSPDESTSYSVGDILPGGGEVIYKGSATSYNHTVEGSKANYKIWSVSTANTYSTALSASTVLPASLPFFDGFEDDFGWNTVAYKDDDWYRGQAVSSDGNYAAYISNNGSFTTDFSNYWNEDATVLELPVNLAGFNEISVSFDWMAGGPSYETTKAYVKLENGAASPVDFNTVGLTNQYSWASASYSTSETACFGSSSVLKFYFYSNTNTTDLGFAVDNVNIEGTLNDVSGQAAENNGGLKNNLSWTNAAENLEVVIVAGLNSEALGSLTSGDTYYEGDILSGGGKIVYIGSGESYIDENVMPGQTYEYKIFQKNGLTYSAGVTTNTVTVPDNVGFFEDFESGDAGWSATTFNGNTWYVGTPTSDGNGTNVAFITNNSSDPRYAYDKHQGATVSFSRTVSFAAFASGTQFAIDYLADVRGVDVAHISLVDHNNGDNELLSGTSDLSSASWTSYSEGISPTADGSGNDSLTLTVSLDISSGSNGTYSPGFLIDNISITGSYDNTSIVSNGAGSQTISSLIDNSSSAVEVLTFDITDAGSGDGKPTDIHQMTFTEGSGNTLANWREVLDGAALYDASDVLIAYGLIQTQSILFDQENLLSIPDGTTESYKLKIWLKETLGSGVDNETLDFSLSSADIVAYNGSAFGGSTTTAGSNNSTITIVATELTWAQSPSTSAIAGTDLTTQPIVIATDANGNTDSDYSQNVTLSSTPAGVSGTTTVVASGGTATFTDIVFGTDGTYTLTASSGTLTSVTSDDITVLDGGEGTSGGPEYIAAVKLAGIENYTYGRSTGGYGLFLDQQAHMTKGVAYELSVYVSGTADLKVFIDYDGDNVYDSGEEIADFGSVSDGLSQAWVTIPASETSGTYRMRVEFVDGSDNGEIEDYTAVVTDNQWTGYTPEWDVTANWSSGEVPTDNVYIPADPVDGNFFPVLDADLTVDQLTIESGGKITLKPGVSLTLNTSLNNDGLIVLKSTVDAVSALNVPEGNTDSGQGQVELSLTADQWYRLGQPVSSPTGAIYDADQSTSWIYRSASQWERITDNGNAIDPMEGIMVQYESDHTINYSGTLNTGAMSRSITYGTGYYLFSNPYPSAMKWDVSGAGAGVSLSANVAPTIYYRVYAGSLVGDYMITYNGSTGVSTYHDGLPGGYTASNIGNISPLQSVWVNVTASGTATIDLDNRARSTDNSVPLKSASLNSNHRYSIKLKQSNAIISDVAVVYFDDNFAEDVGREDSRKMFNSSKQVSEIYTRVNREALAIDGLPALEKKSYSIPLSVRNKIIGDVSLSVNLEEFTDDFDVVLEDRKTGAWTNMRDVDEYVYTPAQTGDVDDRFVLHLDPVVDKVPTNVESPDESGGITIIGQKEYAKVNISSGLFTVGKATIELMDMNGRLISREQTHETETEVMLPGNRGMYILKVTAGGQHKTEKVVAVGY
jgi:hypothetical protein